MATVEAIRNTSKNTAVTRLLHPAGVLADRDARCLLVQAILPIALVLLGIKALKLTFTFIVIEGNSSPFHNIYELLVTSVTIRVGAMAILAFFVAQSLRGPRLATGTAVFFLLILTWYLKSRLAHQAFRPALYGKEEWLFLSSMLRMDLVFLGGYSLFIYLAIVFWQRNRTRWLRAILLSMVALMLSISGLEAANFYKTGEVGTGELLRFFLANAVNLWPMLKTEFNFITIVILILPLLVGFAIVRLIRFWYHRTLSVSSYVSAIPILSLLMLTATFAQAAPHEHRYDRFVDNTYLSLTELIPWRNSVELEAIARAARMPPIQDTSNLRLRERSGVPVLRKNVIIIMLESVRARSTSIYQPDLDSTPFLAEFSRRGATVSSMYAVMPRTTGAWVAILDGMFPSPDDEITEWSRRSERNLMTMPRLLATRGYTSAFFTSAHLFFGYDEPLVKNMGFGSVNYADTLPNKGFEHPTYWGYEDRIIVQPALDWVEQQQNRKRPFLLTMMTTTSHYDYRPPTTWPRRHFNGASGSYNDYLNCLAYVDSVMNEFITGLERLGALDSSIVIIVGDHGESLGEHGPVTRSEKVYEESLRIPGIVFGKGVVDAGSTIIGPRQEIDVMPTIFDALSVDVEDSRLVGSSMIRPAPPNRDLFFAGTLDRNTMAVQRMGLKFIFNFGRLPTEVYDLASDPNEGHDLRAITRPQDIEGAEMDMLVWRMRSQAQFRAGAARTAGAR